MDIFLALMATSLFALVAMVLYRYWEIRRGAIRENDIEDYSLYSRYLLLRFSKNLVAGSRSLARRGAHAMRHHPAIAKTKERIREHKIAKKLTQTVSAVQGRRTVAPAGRPASDFLKDIAEHKSSISSASGGELATEAMPAIGMTGTMVETRTTDQL